MPHVWRVALLVIRVLIGTILLLVGIIGLATPVLPGWAFLIPGALILARDIPFFRRLLKWADQNIISWFERKFPRIRRPLEKLRNTLRHHPQNAQRSTVPKSDASQKK